MPHTTFACKGLKANKHPHPSGHGNGWQLASRCLVSYLHIIASFLPSFLRSLISLISFPINLSRNFILFLSPWDPQKEPMAWPTVSSMPMWPIHKGKARPNHFHTTLSISHSNQSPPTSCERVLNPLPFIATTPHGKFSHLCTPKICSHILPVPQLIF